MRLRFIAESGIKAQPRRKTKSLTTDRQVQHIEKGGKSFVKSESTNSGHKALNPALDAVH